MSRTSTAALTVSMCGSGIVQITPADLTIESCPALVRRCCKIRSTTGDRQTLAVQTTRIRHGVGGKSSGIGRPIGFGDTVRHADLEVVDTLLVVAGEVSNTDLIDGSGGGSS